MDDTLFTLTLVIITFLIMIFLVLLLDNRLTKVESKLRALRSDITFADHLTKSLWDKEDTRE